MYGIGQHNARDLRDQAHIGPYATVIQTVLAYQCLDLPSIFLVRKVIPRLYARHWTHISRRQRVWECQTDLQVSYMRTV